MIPKLTLQLLRMLAAGTLNASQVQALAAAAYADGWGHHDDLSRRLAHAGGAGSRNTKQQQQQQQ